MLATSCGNLATRVGHEVDSRKACPSPHRQVSRELDAARMRWPLRTPSTWQRRPSPRPTTTTDHPEEQMSTAATVAPCSALEKERVESRTTEGAADLRAELAQGLGDRLGP